MLPAAAGEEKGDLAGTPRTPAGGLASPCTPLASAGGDVFMLIWDAKTRKLHALNGSGRAPQGMTPEFFAAQGLQMIPERGPLPITVPGAVDGWFEALERFGKLPVEAIFAPAIAYAEEGMPVTSKLSCWLSQAEPL